MADLFWRVAWSLLVLPEAVWNTVRDRRTAAFFPPMRCPDVLVDEHAGRVGDLWFGEDPVRSVVIALTPVY